MSTRGAVAFLALIACLRALLVIHHVLADVVDLDHAGDIPFYFQMVQLSDQGLYPFVHFWTEYPPVFPVLITVLYRGLAAVGLNTQQDFTLALQLVLFVVDIANIALLFILIRRVHGTTKARLATAIYAACPALVFFSSGWFDPLAVLFSLGALWALTRKRATTAGVLIALGILTKMYPGVFILAMPVALGWRRTRHSLTWMLGTIATVMVPLLLVRADLLLASFASMVNRPPWETVPALLAGNYAWGTVPDPLQRLTAASAFLSSGTPLALTILPAMVLGLAVLGAWCAFKTEGNVYAVAALAVTTFVLGNKGFSPQFIAWIIPMILLVWPNRTGLAYVVLLSVHFLAYDRFVFPAMHDYFTSGQITFDAMTTLVWISVLSRTLLIAAMALHLLVNMAIPWRAGYPFSGVPWRLLPSQRTRLQRQIRCLIS